MIKLLIFFRKPTHADVFEERFSQHVQLINAMPNVQRTVVNRALGAPRGEAAYYLIHEVFFADMPAATYALNTPEGRAAGADLMSFAREIATMMFAEVWGEDNVELQATSAEPELAPAAAAASAAVAELAANAAPVAEPAVQKPYTIDDIIAMNRPKVEPEAVPEVAAEAVAEAAPVEPPKPSRPSLGESLES
jgi:uncharacterized protein (TIGR02118 family)